MTNGSDKMTETVHAASTRGIKHCDSTISGDGRANVEKYPERWSQVTCTDCIKTK